jgi:ParB family chromosome partitioning protein
MLDGDWSSDVCSSDLLQELADSVREHGIKTPISVKSKNAAGHYLINYGARRFRAAARAGLATVPAFIDDAHDDYAQVVENVQRDDLRPLEIARFIGAKIAAGVKAKDIGTKFGKPKAWVSKHAALVDTPEYIAKAADAGLVRSYDALYELTVHVEQHPENADAVQQFLSRDTVATQGEIRQFLQSLASPAVTAPGSTPPAAPKAPESTGEGTPPGKPSGTAEVSLTKLSTPTDPTRTSTPAEQDAAAAQHATDAFFRKAHENDTERTRTSTPQTPKDREPTITAGFDQGRGETAPRETEVPETHPVSHPVLMFTKGSRGGTVNLDVATRYGWLMVRYEGEETDVEEKAEAIQLKALIDGGDTQVRVGEDRVQVG